MRATARRVYSLLVLACRQRPENELYLSKWLPALVEHLPLNVGAEEALTEILSDNRQLLQAQVNGGLLTLFSDLIIEQGKRPSYLHFLKALTACDGVPLDRHQVSVCELLYGERYDGRVSDRSQRTAPRLLLTPLLVLQVVGPPDGTEGRPR